jgi:hypothetical protein
MADNTEILLRVKADGEQLKKLTAEFDKLKGGLKQTGTEAKAAGKEMNSLASVKLGAAIAASAAMAVGAFRGLRAALSATLVEGVRFTASMEQSAAGVAGILMAFRPAEFKNFQSALRTSTELLDELKQSADRSPASLNELTTAFQQTAGLMMEANIPLEKQVGLVINMSQAMATSRIPIRMMRMELQAILSGTISATSRLAPVLGITQADVRGATEKGRLFDLLTNKLSTFGAAADAASSNIERLEGDLGNARARAAAKATVGLADAYRDLLKAMMALVNSPAFASLLGSAADGASRVVGGATALARGVVSPGNLENAGAAGFGLAAGVGAGLLAKGGAGALAGGGGIVASLQAFGAALAAAITPALAFGAAVAAIASLGISINQILGNKIGSDVDRAVGEDARRKALNDALNKSTDAETQARIGEEAARRQALFTAQAEEAKAKGQKDEVARLTVLADQYGLIQKSVQIKGEALIASNLALEEERKASSALAVENQKRAARSAALAEEHAKNLADAEKARFDLMADEEKLLTLKRLQLEASNALAGSPGAAAFSAVGSEATEENRLAAESAKLAAEARYLSLKREVADLEDRIAKNAEANAKRIADAEKKRTDAALKAKEDLFASALREQDDAAKAIERAHDAEIAAIRVSKFLTERERQQLLYNAYLEKEKTLKEQIAIAEQIRAAALASNKDSAAAVQAQSRLDSLNTELQVNIPTELAENSPRTMMEDFQIGLVNLKSGFQSLGEIAANGVGSAFASINHHLTAALTLTQSWGQSLWGVAQTMLTSVVGAIVQVSTQWVARKLIEFTVGKSLAAASAAANLAIATPVAAKLALLWTPAATMATIATLGGAAAQAPLSMAGATAAAQAVHLAPGMADGGYAGPGRKYEPAGVYHRGEIVFSQSNIARLGGVEAVEAMRVSGAVSPRGAGVTASPASGGSGGPAIGAGGGINQAFFNTKQDAEQWLASQRGRRVLTDFLRDESYNL